MDQGSLDAGDTLLAGAVASLEEEFEEVEHGEWERGEREAEGGMDASKCISISSIFRDV